MNLIKIDSRGRINVNDFKDYLDPKKVKQVEFTDLGSGVIGMVFLDENENEIPVLAGRLNRLARIKASSEAVNRLNDFSYLKKRRKNSKWK